MIIITVGADCLLRLPTADNDNGTPHMEPWIIDPENILNDPALASYGHQGPILGYRHLARPVICWEK